MDPTTSSSLGEEREGKPRATTGDAPRGVSPSADDIVRLDDLRALSEAATDALAPPGDLYAELYSEEPLHLFTAAPLPDTHRPAKKVPRHLMALGALLLFLAGTASPLALAGFNKAPVTTIATTEPEPFKAYPDIDRRETGADLDETASTGDSASSPTEIAFADEDVVTSTPAPMPVRPRSIARSSRGASSPAPSSQPQTQSTVPTTEESDAVRTVLDDVLGPRSSLQPSATVLPQSPTRAQVLSGLRGVSPAVARCSDDHGGRVTVDVTIHGPTGRVAGARVTDGADPSTAVCVARAVSQARFPRFADEDFTVSSFPFTIR